MVRVREQIRPYLQRTPLDRYPALDRLTGAEMHTMTVDRAELLLPMLRAYLDSS